MSKCTLDQHQEYNLVSVQFDNGTGKYQVHLSNPPTSCPDGFFTSKGATLVVDPNISVSKLTYTNHPVVLVPSKGVVQQVDSTPPSSFGFGTLLIIVLIGAAIFAWYKGLFNNFLSRFNPVIPTPTPETPTTHTSSFENKPVENKATSEVEAVTTQHVNNARAPISTTTSSYRRGGTRVEERAAPPAAQAPVSQTVVHTYQPAPVVVNNGPGDFLTGMMVGNALSGGGYHHDTEIIHEREVVHDHDRYSDDNRGSDRYSSDDNSSSSHSSSNDSNSSSRYSSDDDSSSSYSSDSSSSYSSDSSSSYSSDSSSSYSSDSGSSDSGSFSSDF